MPAVFLLASWLAFVSTPASAQLACDNDGIDIEFDEKRGSVELKDARVREITGNNRDDRDVSLGNVNRQRANFSGGAYRVDTLSLAAFPDEGIGFASFERDEGKVWRARYPKDLYQFADKDDLVLEIDISVQSGVSTHVVLGNDSWAAMSVEDIGIDAKFHGGKTKSLKELRGDLNFRFFDLLNVSAAGIHRADISICINVRGTI